MIRRLFNLLTALSLLLCVAVAVLWVRTYWVRDQMRWATESGSYVQVNTDSGWVGCTLCDETGFAGLEWTGGSDPVRFPTGALPDPAQRQRFDTDERILWFVKSSLDHGLVRIEDGRRLVEEGLGKHDPDPPDFGGVTTPYTAYAVRICPAVVLLGVMPLARLAAASVRVVRGRSRRSRGLCPRCAYDLRATPGRCPECGTMAPGQPSP